MAPLASLAVLLEDQVHQMFPLMAENWRSSQMRSLLEMQGQILKAAATEQRQSVLQGRETQSSNSTCISPGCRHKTERKAVRAISWTRFGLVPAPMRVWDAWQTRPLQQSSSLLRPSCQTIGWRCLTFSFQTFSSAHIPADQSPMKRDSHRVQLT